MRSVRKVVQMIPIVPIVGKSSIGKTTFLEKVIHELKNRGRRVAVIKHDVHGFEMDQPGKDTWKFSQAGADVVILSSPNKLALIQKTGHDMTPDEVENELIHGVDIVLAEGYKRSTKKKIEVYRKAAGSDLLCREEELIALVTDHPFPMNVPQFGLEDASALVDFLEENIIGRKHLPAVSITADGRRIPLDGFAEDIVAKGILGILSALRGVEEPAELTIRIRVS